MKNNHNLSVVNQELIDYQPLFNKAVKSIEYPIGSEPGFIGQTESVTFICDYEGTILYTDKTFVKDNQLFDCIDNKTILDFIHPEDVSFVIEYLVQLLQEKTDSFIFEARLLFEENQYFLTKWHVSYLRGLFYFYPITVPTSQLKFSGSKIKKAKVNLNLNNATRQLWKIEVSKTLFEMDKMILKHLKSCTNF